MHPPKKVLNRKRTCTELHITALEAFLYDGHGSINRHLNAIVWSAVDPSNQCTNWATSLHLVQMNYYEHLCKISC